MPKKDQPLLLVENLTLRKDKKLLIKKACFSLSAGTINVLVGPNGAGKTSLAEAIIGYPSSHLTRTSKIFFRGKDISRLKMEERARQGIFLAFQNPFPLEGLTLEQVLLRAIRAREKSDPSYPRRSLRQLRQEIEATAAALQLDPALLRQSLHLTFSGGERKKIELLQCQILRPHLALLDEIDSGLDLAALSRAANLIRGLVEGGERTVLLISHFSPLLRQLPLDQILWLANQELKVFSDPQVLQELEKKELADGKA